MNSRNEYLRKIKEEAIKQAIKHLNSRGVKKITNKKIVETITRLFPTKSNEDLDRQINVNTLSKTPYYKENLPKWIAEVTGAKPNEKALKAAKRAKEKIFQAKLKQIEKYASKLIDGIFNGEVECKMFSKRFVRDWIVENTDMELSESIFSSTDAYKDLFKRIETNFHGKNSPSNDSGISMKEIGELKRDLKIANQKLAHFVTNSFVSVNNNETPLVEGDGNEFKGIYVNKEALYEYLEFMKNKFDKEINAYFLFKGIIEETRLGE